MRQLFTTAILFLACILSSYAEKKTLTRQEYISQFSPVAIEEMNRYRIPASITLAQGILESGNGNSSLAQKEKNHFGIKCGSKWKGPSGRYDDDARNECFRAYESAWESYRDHSEFLVKNQRYAFLFDFSVSNYKSWAKGLKKAGYATDPSYANRLIKIIEDNKLHQYDKYYQKDASHLASNTPSNSSGRMTISSKNNRKLKKRNNLLSTLAVAGDTYEKIARVQNLDDWQIYKYNDAAKGAKLKLHEVVYLQNKKGKAPKGHETYTLKSGESLWTVSQKYGVRLSKLYRLNRMKYSDRPKVGQVIYLRHKKAK